MGEVVDPVRQGSHVSTEFALILFVYLTVQTMCVANLTVAAEYAILARPVIRVKIMNVSVILNVTEKYVEMMVAEEVVVLVMLLIFAKTVYVYVHLIVLVNPVVTMVVEVVVVHVIQVIPVLMECVFPSHHPHLLHLLVNLPVKTRYVVLTVVEVAVVHV